MDRTKGRINSAATVTNDVTCVNAHFHDNVIRRSAEAILIQRAESRKSDPPSGSGVLNWVALYMMEVVTSDPRLRSEVTVGHTGVHLSTTTLKGFVFNIQACPLCLCLYRSSFSPGGPQPGGGGPPVGSQDRRTRKTCSLVELKSPGHTWTLIWLRKYTWSIGNTRNA